MRHVRLIVAALGILAATAGLHSQVRIPSLPGGVKVPGVEHLVKEEPAITTSFKDARPEAPPLDGWTPKHLQPLASAPRLPDGSFRLARGAVYEGTFESYCLHAGTHAPAGGDGFLIAPIAGKDATIVRHILQNANAHPEIPERDIQPLLWGIIAKWRVSHMAPNLQKAAHALLTAKEYSDLDGSEWEKLPPSTKNKIRQSLPESARQTFDAENRLRTEFGRPNARYEDLERAAVLSGPSKDAQARKIPDGRWSVDQSGALVRYFPNGFRTTRVQVLVPERFTVERDRQGRIIAVSDDRGNRTETTYDDTVRAPALPSPSRFVAYAFKSVRFIRPAPSGQGKPEIFEIRDKGFTFVVDRRAPRSRAALDWFLDAFVPVLHAQDEGHFGQWPQRVDQAQEVHDRWNYYNERYDRATKPASADDVANLEDQQHWNDGLDAATRGTEADRMEWIIDNQERQNRSLAYGINVLNQMSGTSNTDVNYDTTANVGVPARTGSQRVGLSTRMP